ncbi:hypothetical protein N752_07175 [Desulforamulus aquiferis]|nr:hypothetical protein [Desulforamulus aquiferis]RYD05670.1 hypothetical protein N752_07175 [Desulforamulus aquiferis]
MIRLFLLGTAFGGLLIQRGILPIHGSAVVIDGYSVLFAGVTGAGKSTLLAAFRKQGYSFLTDDVAALTMDRNGIVWVHPSYPQQKLWRDSAEITGVNTSTLTPFYIGSNNEKFAVPINSGFCESAMPLAAVYELIWGKCEAVAITPLSNIEKMTVLMDQTYRHWLVDGLGQKISHFKQCALCPGRLLFPA